VAQEQSRRLEQLGREEEEAEGARREGREGREKIKFARRSAERRKEQSTVQLREMLDKARVFRHSQLLISGLAPWQQLMEQSRLENIKALTFRRDRLLQAAWSDFLGSVVALRTERFRLQGRATATACAHYRRRLLRQVWRLLRLHHKVLKAKARAVTGHFSRFTLVRRAFGGWRITLERALRRQARAMRQVCPRGDLSQVRFYWARWAAFHAGALEEREIGRRSSQKWAAVQGWLHGV